tara:strand:+ start:126 stop:500 length:375 start_codon:yes stop_codon:yes gene_type:complete
MHALRVAHKAARRLLAAGAKVIRLVVLGVNALHALHFLEAALAGGEVDTRAATKARTSELLLAEDARRGLAGKKKNGLVRLAGDGKASFLLDHPNHILAARRALVHRLLGAQVALLVLGVTTQA